MFKLSYHHILANNCYISTCSDEIDLVKTETRVKLSQSGFETARGLTQGRAYLPSEGAASHEIEIHQSHHFFPQTSKQAQRD